MFDIYYGIKNDKIFSKNLFYFFYHKLQKHSIFLWLMYAKMVTIEITKKFTGFLTKFWIIWIFGKTQIKYFLIDQFRYIKIQSQTMDFRARLWGINPTNSVFIPQEPRTEVYCLRLNFNISKLVYFTSRLLYLRTIDILYDKLHLQWWVFSWLYHCIDKFWIKHCHGNYFCNFTC